MRYQELLETSLTAYTSVAFRKSASHPADLGVWFTTDREAVKSHLTSVGAETGAVEKHLVMRNPRIFPNYVAFFNEYREAGGSVMRNALMLAGHDGIMIYRTTKENDTRVDVVVFDKSTADAPVSKASLDSLSAMLRDPRPIEDMYQVGDMLRLNGEDGEVIRAKPQTLVIRFPSGDRIVSRSEPDLEVTPFREW